MTCARLLYHIGSSLAQGIASIRSARLFWYTSMCGANEKLYVRSIVSSARIMSPTGAAHHFLRKLPIRLTLPCAASPERDGSLQEARPTASSLFARQLCLPIRSAEWMLDLVRNLFLFVPPARDN